MRRTRHVVLPVRSWQYIGLLIVSLACLTLGLVSRDREGHAGSLTGPELEHRAPHEMDACPNLNPFSQLDSCVITQSEKTTKPINDYENKIFRSTLSPVSRTPILSRSLILDRSSRVALQNIRERSSKSDLRAVDRSRSHLSSNTNSINKSGRESRSRTIMQFSDTTNSYYPTRFSRSWDLQNGQTTDRRSFERRLLNSEKLLTDRKNDRSENRASILTERRKINKIISRQNRADQSIVYENSLDSQSRINDNRVRRSFSTERRIVNGNNRQESRGTSRRTLEYRDVIAHRVNRQSESREHRSRSIPRYNSNTAVRRVIEHQDHSNADRRSLINRGARIVRQDTDRNNNQDRRSTENRRILLDRKANREHNSRFSMNVRNGPKYLDRTSDRRTLSRSMESLITNGLAREISSKRVRSTDFIIERSINRRSPLQDNFVVRSTVHREIDHAERQDESRLRDRKFLDQVASRISNRERINQSRRIAGQRVWHRNVAIKESHSRNTPTDSTRFDLRRSLERRIDENTKSRERSRMENRRIDRSFQLPNSNSIRVTERKANSKEPIPQIKSLRFSATRLDARRNLQIRNLKERGAISSIENRLTEYPEKEFSRLREKSLNLNDNNPSRLASLRRVARTSRVLDQSREQRKLLAGRILSRTLKNDRTIAKWEGNLQDTRIDKIIRTKIIPISMKNKEFLQYPVIYNVARQALVIALCLVYGFSTYNGKKSIFSSNIIQRVHQFLVW